MVEEVLFMEVFVGERVEFLDEDGEVGDHLHEPVFLSG